MIRGYWIAIGAVVLVAVGVVAFVSSGASTPGTAEQRLASWVTSTTLGQDIGTIEGDSAAVREALGKKARTSATELRTVCAAMATSAQTFNDQLPSPDAAVTQLLAKAYGLAYDAAEACYRAGIGGRSLLARSARDRSQASALFAEVLRRVRAVTGKSVSTTTTTVPDLTGTGIL